MTCNDCLHCEACNRLAVGYNIMQIKTCVCASISLINPNGFIFLPKTAKQHITYLDILTMLK